MRRESTTPVEEARERKRKRTDRSAREHARANYGTRTSHHSHRACAGRRNSQTACRRAIAHRGCHPPGALCPAAAGDSWYPARQFWPRPSHFWPRPDNKRGRNVERFARAAGATIEVAPPRRGKRHLERRTSALATARDRALRQSWPNSRPLRTGPGRAAGRAAFSDRPVLPNTRARARIPHESW